MDFSKTSIVELAAILAEHLEQHGVEVVLVGGLAVEIYTSNQYLTKDIDMVNTNYQKPARLHEVMQLLGFKKRGRIYVNTTTEISVEFPSGPLAVAGNIITQTTIAETSNGRIPILHVSDVVKDRIAAYLHWQDRQSLIQAIAILLTRNLAPNKFKLFFEAEGNAEAYPLFKKIHQEAKRKEANTMQQLEQLLVEILLR